MGVIPTMVRFSLEITAPEEKREEIEAILRSLAGPTGVMEGCLGCSISQDLEDPAILRLREEWETEEHLKSRLRADDFRKVLAAMDLSREPPRVCFELPSGEQGMEYLSAARGTLLGRQKREA